MIFDHGALLETDSKGAINLNRIDRGTTGSGEITFAIPPPMHVPYFQAARAPVLMFWVNTPGETMTLPNTRSFTPSPTNPRQIASLRQPENCRSLNREMGSAADVMRNGATAAAQERSTL